MPEHLRVFTSPEGEASTLAAYDTVVARWPVPCEELDIPTSFGDTHVIASGPEDGPVVILLHALFATAAAWYRNAGALSERYRVYAVDVMGEANKSRPTRPIRNLDDYAQWVDELAEALGVDEMSLVGNSFGGFGAAACAMRFGPRVKRLVLIAPASTFHSMSAFYLRTFAPKAAYLFMPWLPGQERTIRRGIRWLLADIPPDEAWGPLFEQVMLHGTTATQLFPRIYKAEELAAIECPTMLLLGDRERIYPPAEVARDAKRLMPKIRVEMVPDAHHFTAIANPGAVNALLLEFLE